MTSFLSQSNFASDDALIAAKGQSAFWLFLQRENSKTQVFFFSLLSIYFINHSLGISYKQDIWMHSGQEQRDDSDL